MVQVLTFWAKTQQGQGWATAAPSWPRGAPTPVLWGGSLFHGAPPVLHLLTKGLQMRQFPPKQGQRISSSPSDLVKPEIFLQNLEELPSWVWEKPIFKCLGNQSIPLAGQLLPFSEPETAWLPREDGLSNFHIGSSLKFLLKMREKNLSLIFTLVLLLLQSAGSFSSSKYFSYFLFCIF